MSGGWGVCPACGAVVADTAAHTLWHEVALPETITDLAAQATPADTTDTEEHHAHD